MHKFVKVAVPVTIGLVVGAIVAINHKEEIKGCIEKIKKMGTEKLDKASKFAYVCVNKNNECPDDFEDF